MNPAHTALYIPAGLSSTKMVLFERIGAQLGRVIRADVKAVERLPGNIIPIVGCSPELRPLIKHWRATNRQFVYWDRGYARRVYATHLPRGEDGGYYRWHRNAYQMRQIGNFPSDRWDALKTEVKPWAKTGNHIVIAAPSMTYGRFHGTENWIAETIRTLALNTDRQLVIRDKESKRKLQQDIEGAHALVTHGSNAAVEAAILGCPVFVHPDSAASLIGQTDLTQIEKPIYPDRQPWLNALAYNQFNEKELVNGKLWKMIQ